MVKTYNPESFNDALKIKSEIDSILYAGGTDLMVRRRSWSGVTPEFEKDVIFIGRLPEIKKVEMNGGKLKIGSACTLDRISKYKILPKVLREAASLMCSPAIRNIGTIGGNICNASPAGDIIVPLVALNASLILQSFKGKRELLIADFISGPGKININNDEILKEVIIPIDNFNIEFYKKVGTRKADALSKVSFTCLKRVNGNIIEDIRISIGAVAPKVVRVKEIENKIIGKSINEISNSRDEFVKMYCDYIKPITDQRSTAEYRKKVALKLIENVLKEH